MDNFFDHIGLNDWPFSVVPRPEHCTFIAGRDDLRNDVSILLKSISRQDASSIHVLWSWFGAGKTHSLYFLANEARRLTSVSPPVPLYPIYTEFPKGVRGFVDLFRSFVANLDLNLVIDSFLELTTSADSERFQADLLLNQPDLAAALRIMAIGSPPERAIATRWMRGDALPPSEFRKIGISQKISSTERATQVLAFLIHLLGDAHRKRGHKGSRILWLLDEFQRLSQSGRQIISDVNAGLHSLFNACPSGLTPVISFSGRPDSKKLPDWISPELRDRIGATKVMILPPLQPEEAVGFVKDVLTHFRSDDVNIPSPYFPFTKQTCQVIVDHVVKNTTLRPRIIMHAFNAVLEVADSKIEQGEIKIVTPEFAKEVLSQYLFVSDSEHGEEN